MPLKKEDALLLSNLINTYFSENAMSFKLLLHFFCFLNKIKIAIVFLRQTILFIYLFGGDLNVDKLDVVVVV